jgi:hypothetical protein
MTRRRPPHIRQRRPVYVGCEGASEVSYASFLQDLIHEAGLPVHLEIQDLGLGAGDPLARIDMAVSRLEQLRRKRFEPVDRFVLLDFDQAERHPIRANQAQQTADRHKIIIVWQRPCFEAVLLRHLDGYSTKRPPDVPLAERALLKAWPDYKKPLARARLAQRLDRGAVLRAANVEPELKRFLQCLGIA